MRQAPRPITAGEDLTRYLAAYDRAFGPIGNDRLTRAAKSAEADIPASCADSILEQVLRNAELI
jgi:hypothetical protein